MAFCVASQLFWETYTLYYCQRLKSQIESTPSVFMRIRHEMGNGALGLKIKEVCFYGVKMYGNPLRRAATKFRRKDMKVETAKEAARNSPIIYNMK